MADDQPGYQSYLLRLWRTTSQGRSTWHASLELPHTGERRGFASLEQLYAFLEQQTQAGDPSVPRSPPSSTP
jgi:hypothetical protein